MIDDSSLFHGTYDPVKAREYYLRTRKLKGRRRATATLDGPGRGGRRPAAAPAAGGKPNRSKTKSRRAELQAQKDALEKRLDRLREILAQKVKEAKRLQAKNAPKRPKGRKKDKKGTAPETKVDVADRGKAEKSKNTTKTRKLTASQKAAKNKKAKEAYEKEHPNSLSNDVEILKLQVEDIRHKIKKAVEDAQAARHKAGANDTPRVRQAASSKPNDGPRGR